MGYLNWHIYLEEEEEEEEEEGYKRIN